VDAGIFHDFHVGWIGQLRSALNAGLLPQGYYALAEQHTGHAVADVLTLHATPLEAPAARLPGMDGGTAVLEMPPKVRRRLTIDPQKGQGRTLAVRHVSGHQLVAVIEIVSPANKDREQSVAQFAGKVADLLNCGVHVLIVDVLPPGANDPQGLHERVARFLPPAYEHYEFPAEEPLLLASYSAGRPIEVYLEHLAPGGVLTEMPLFLTPERYVSVPLEGTYGAAYAGMPGFWREVLEGRGV
jgi:hypothetical protein